MAKKVIKLKQIEKNIGWNRDPVGFLFFFSGKVYRVINDEYVDEVKQLFDCGAVDELNKAGVIPHTTISDIYLEGYKLVLEHKKIDVVSYPPEWSFTMLKDAALTVIKVNKILAKYGYETKDAHNYNILFDGTEPRFVDFGSFAKRVHKKYWICRDEFVRFYIYPLYMWAKGNSTLARKILSDSAGYINDYEFQLYKHKFMRLLPKNFTRGMFMNLEYVRNLSRYNIDTLPIIKNADAKRKLIKLIYAISKIGLLPNNYTNFDSLERQVKKFKSPGLKSLWGEYHTVTESKDAFGKDSRFNIVLDLIKKYQVTNVLEIGGNQGLFARELSTHIDKVICSDYDENAVDQMYIKSKAGLFKITPVLLNFLHPFSRATHFSERVSTFERFNSQAVVALALTHHLILTQKVPIDIIFEAIGRYNREYLFIEFMPKGVSKLPPPDWYTIDWFRDNFKRYYKLLNEVVTTEDKGRILFVGKKL